MRAVSALAASPMTRRRSGESLSTTKRDFQVAAFGHDTGAADKRHEDHEKDGELLREGKGEVGQIAHHHVGEGDEPQQPDGNPRQITLRF